MWFEVLEFDVDTQGEIATKQLRERLMAQHWVRQRDVGIVDLPASKEVLKVKTLS